MNISEAISKIFGVVNKTIAATHEDSPGGKKVTFGEALDIAIKSIGLVPVFTGLQQLIEDWESRDDIKKAQWIQAFKENFNLDDDELEVQIEEGVSALLNLEGVFGVFASAKKDDQQPPSPGTGGN